MRAKTSSENFLVCAGCASWASCVSNFQVCADIFLASMRENPKDFRAGFGINLPAGRFAPIAYVILADFVSYALI